MSGQIGIKAASLGYKVAGKPWRVMAKASFVLLRLTGCAAAIGPSTESKSLSDSAVENAGKSEWYISSILLILL